MVNSSILSVKCQIRKDLFNEFIGDYKQVTSDALYDSLVQARTEAVPLTPMSTHHTNGGPRLNNPEIHRYDNGTCSIQWRANRNGFYYGYDQDTNYSYSHPNGGGPGFIEAVQEYFSQYAPNVIAEMMDAKGW